MNEQVCTKAVDTCGYPVETTGNAVLDTLEHRSSTRAFARDDDDRPVAVTDEQRAAILHAASGAPSAGAMLMMTRLPGIFSPISRRAESIRCWLSFTALSGKPTIINFAPQRILTSIVMVKALIPYTAPPKILTNIPSDLMFHIQACKLRLFHMKTMQNRLFVAIKFFKRNLLSVEYGITEMRDPVSRVDIVAVGFEFKIER